MLPNPYARWGGFATGLYEVEDGAQACADDPSIRKLDALNALCAQTAVKPRRIPVVAVCSHLIEVFDGCRFTVREVDRLNSPALDGLIVSMLNKSRAVWSQWAGDTILQAARTRQPPRLVGADLFSRVCQPDPRLVQPVVYLDTIRLFIELRLHRHHPRQESHPDRHREWDALLCAILNGSMPALVCMLDAGVRIGGLMNKYLTAAHITHRWDMFRLLLARGGRFVQPVPEDAITIESIIRHHGNEILLLLDPVNYTHFSDLPLEEVADFELSPDNVVPAMCAVPEHDYDIASTIAHTWTMALYASLDFPVDVFDTLLHHSGDVAETIRSMELLRLAIRRRSVETVTYLLNLGACFTDGNALCEAVNVKNMDLIRLLLERGADPNMAGTTSTRHQDPPSLIAIEREDVPMLQLLLDFGAVFNGRMLREAVSLRCLEVLTYLRQRFPSEFCRLATVGLFSVYHICFLYASAVEWDERAKPVLDMLLQAGADVNWCLPYRSESTSTDGALIATVDQSAASAAHSVCNDIQYAESKTANRILAPTVAGTTDSRSVMEYMPSEASGCSMMESMAVPNAAADTEGKFDDGGLGREAEWGPLVVSVRNWNDAWVRALLLAGADVHFRSDTALLSAIENARDEDRRKRGLYMVRILLSAGASVGARDHEALMQAVRSGDVPLMELLIQCGGDMSARGGAILAEARIAGAQYPALQQWLLLKFPSV